MPAAALPNRRDAVTCLLGAMGALACPGLSLAAAPAELRILTEELPPYNMTQDDKVTGLSTEIVRAVLEALGQPTAIQVMPWARAYNTALNEPNVLIYSISRTAQREKLFKWVGVVAPTRWYLFALAARPVKLTRLEDARKYQIATVHEDAGEQYLASKGLLLGQNLQSSSKYELNYEKLKQGRVDLWISNELNALYLVRRTGDDPAKLLVRALHLPDVGSEEGLNMAFSLGTPDAVVERFRKGLETIKKNGSYERIQKRWL
ncbi:transporter substrate-binding domain-containing protein [Ideonella azotifigens]|uniref:Transporter substrate-binding domain-containing protein n=1 Tax=Ideonella azotifigens TaxID=513160 RepID=A0ABN1JP37_9BURK|nr:transporter substrate-binding domain-containing protein [Ideonella azotifigens]MCD2340028.1 transporter substrate-binding domain-containing protein [Ideonella azotifigens]